MGLKAKVECPVENEHVHRSSDMYHDVSGAWLHIDGHLCHAEPVSDLVSVRLVVLGALKVALENDAVIPPMVEKIG